MTAALDVAPDEWGVVRLFVIDLPADEIDGFVAQGDVVGIDGRRHWPLRDALGATRLEEDRLEVFPVGDVAALGLSAYLTDGLGIPEGALAPERSKIDAVQGIVLVVTSLAMGGVAQTLDPKPPLRHIGTYHEEPLSPVIGRIESEGAQGKLAKRAEPVVSKDEGRLVPVLIVIAAILLGAGIIAVMALGMG
ncbi:MAG: hypothetical protein AAGB18_03560 [Pseudomonadota bacterium]